MILEDPITHCWMWQGRVQSAGYGAIDRGRLAHRIYYEDLVGPIPEGLHIDHLCRTPLCVNPGHMEPVTFQENIRRSPNSNVSKTHCIHGHPFNGENTRWRRDGRRACRLCERERDRRRYWRAKVSLPDAYAELKRKDFA